MRDAKPKSCHAIPKKKLPNIHSYIHLFIYLSIYLYIHLSIHLFIIHLSSGQSSFSSQWCTRRTIRIHLCCSFDRCVNTDSRLSWIYFIYICLSICLSVCPSIHLSVFGWRWATKFYVWLKLPMTI